MTTTAIAENRTIFDDRAISEDNLEVTERGDYALYVTERVDTDTDEIHIFPISSESRDYRRVHQAIRALTGDSDQLVSEVQFQRGEDGRLILKVAENQTPEERSSGQELANHLLSDDAC